MTTAVPHQPTTPERPAWLKPRAPTGVTSPPPTPPGPCVLNVPVPASRWTFSEWSAWCKREFGWGLALSAVLHLTLLLLLSFVVLQGRGTFGWIVQGSLGEEGPEEELDVPLDSRLEAASTTQPFEFVAIAEAEGLEPVLQGAAERIHGALDADGSADHDLGEFGRNVAVPASAITKGSFTVWTNPEVPAPGQAYEIVIQVKLPPHIKSYRLRDLTGTVRGTDRYFKAIAFKPNERRNVTDGVVQVRIPIPGAEELVRDTIKVQSAVLKEEQTIEIVFRNRRRTQP
uniref:Uncharacterized protein n=1 Tax=Schlesneria paludicola TaxID=360056 RepID=A0A7C4QNZ6_9PLAN